MTLDKTLTPVLDGHPDVFDREWSLRVADIDPGGRLRLDAAARHIQDIGQDHVHELGFDESHPLWVVRRTMIDLINSRTRCCCAVGAREPPPGGAKCGSASTAAGAA